jgi:hypothetical protein
MFVIIVLAGGAAMFLLAYPPNRVRPFGTERSELTSALGNTDQLQNIVDDRIVRDLKAQLHADVAKLHSVAKATSSSSGKTDFEGTSSAKNNVGALSRRVFNAHDSVKKEIASSIKLASSVRPQLASISANSDDAAEIRKLRAELAKVKGSLGKKSVSSKTGLDSICEDGSVGCESTSPADIDGDDPDEDRTKQSVLDQILRLPLVYHLGLTLDHVFPDAVYDVNEGAAVAPGALKNVSHPVHIFDDDRIASVVPRESSPLPPSDRGPEYYPGGEFADRFRTPGGPEKVFEGGFDDRDVPVLNDTRKVNITLSRAYMTAENNFRGVADDR